MAGKFKWRLNAIGLLAVGSVLTASACDFGGSCESPQPPLGAESDFMTPAGAYNGYAVIAPRSCPNDPFSTAVIVVQGTGHDPLAENNRSCPDAGTGDADAGESSCLLTLEQFAGELDSLISKDAYVNTGVFGSTICGSPAPLVVVQVEDWRFVDSIVKAVSMVLVEHDLSAEIDIDVTMQVPLCPA